MQDGVHPVHAGTEQTGRTMLTHYMLQSIT